MFIKTAEGWVQLQPKCENRVMRRQTYDPRTKQWNDDPAGEYRLVEITNGLPPAHVERNAYDGGFPSQDLVTFINRIYRENRTYGLFEDEPDMKYSRYTGRKVVAEQVESTDIRIWRF